MGRIIGKDDAQKVIEVLARTCHIRFGSVKIGGKGKASPKGALNYNRRVGKYGPLKDGKLDELERKLAEARTARDEAARAGADNLEPHDKEIPRRERTLKKARDRDAKAAELEYEAGDHEAVLWAADLIAAGAGPRVDRFAERLLISQVAELPADSTPGQRKACAEALVKRWTDAGHPAHAAVHGNGCVQPHVHVLAAARPIRRDGNGVEYADRSVRLWAGQHAKEAVQGERGLVVEIVNRTCPSEVLFHHGRHEDVGIDREAREAAGLLQRRLGRGATHRPESYAVKFGFDEERPRRQAERYALERDARRAAEVAAEKRKAERHRVRVAKAAERAAERTGNAAWHLAGIEAGSVEAPPPVPLKERQREAMQGAIERGGKEADLESGEGQALGFALLNLERARRREKEARERKEALEKAGRAAARHRNTERVLAMKSRLEHAVKEADALRAEAAAASQRARDLELAAAGFDDRGAVARLGADAQQALAFDDTVNPVGLACWLNTGRAAGAEWPEPAIMAMEAGTTKGLEEQEPGALRGWAEKRGRAEEFDEAQLIINARHRARALMQEHRTEEREHGERRVGRAGAGTGADARGEHRQSVDGGERPGDGLAAQGRSTAGHAGGAPGAHGTGGAGRAQDGADVSGGDRVAPTGAGEGGGRSARPPVVGDRGQGARDQPGDDAGHERVEGDGNLHAGGEEAAPPLGGKQPLDQGADVAGSRDAADADALAGLDDLLRHQTDQWEKHDRDRDARSAGAARPTAPNRAAKVKPKEQQTAPKKTQTTTRSNRGRGEGL